MSWYKHCGVWAFVGGVAAACAGAALTSSKAVRDAAVKGAAKGILAADNAQAALQTFKDEAEDLAADARLQAKEDAARKARIAEIEARVRKQVEEELAAEDAKAAQAGAAEAIEAAEAE